MKLLYFAKTTLPSRMANSLHVMKMCQAFALNGHDVTLCIIGDVSWNSVEGQDVYGYYNVQKCFNIVNIPCESHHGNGAKLAVVSLKTLPGIIKIIRKYQPDTVYGRDIFSCCVAAYVGCKTIVESHFPLWHGKLARTLFRLLIRCRNFEKLVVISSGLKDAYRENYSSITKEKILVAPDGADLPCNFSGLQLASARIGALQVGYVGHLYIGKGIEVIEAVAPALDEVDFHIIGGMEEDIERWKGRIKSKNVLFHGFVTQSQLPGYINALDVCLLPNQRKVYAYGAIKSQKEQNISPYTSPLKMFEYMSYGKAIIASDLPSLREVLNDDVAILIDPEDFLSWTRWIKKLEDRKIRNDLGKNAKKLLEHQYTWSIRAENVLNKIAG